MWPCLLLAVLPCLVAANAQCPISCPEGKSCCQVEGQYSCCDVRQDKLEGKRKVFGGAEILQSAFHPNTSGGAPQLETFGSCTYLTCRGGTCCLFEKCCPFANADCCSDGSKCCAYGYNCCPDGCCPRGTTCCPKGCCLEGQDCCLNGCCPFGQQCCSVGCCPVGSKCCGSWCCRLSDTCGHSPFTCSGMLFTPAATTLLFLVAVSVVSKFCFI